MFFNRKLGPVQMKERNKYGKVESITAFVEPQEILEKEKELAQREFVYSLPSTPIKNRGQPK